MNLKVLFTLQLEVIKKSLLVLRQDKLELYQLRLKKKYWELDWALLKTNCFFFETVVDNTSPATTWTSTGSPQPSAQISAPTFQQMQDLSTFMQDKLEITTGPWENMMPKGFLKVSC
jgi:hypothetical protein